MSLSSSTFDFDKLETGKPSKFITNGLYLPKIHVDNEKSDMNSSFTGEELSNVPFRAKTPICGDFKRIHRVVLTGGPCAGKTTSINRMKNFFINIGWKVLCVPETATFLLSAGMLFGDLDDKNKTDFQENLLKTLLQVEDTVNETAKYYNDELQKNCLVIYDRGAMDPVSYLGEGEWEKLKSRNPSWNDVELRDDRYDQIIHLITAANGAEKFYTLDNNATRTETLEIAREVDARTARAWVGHPCIDFIDNTTGFEKKIARALLAVCDRIGLHLKGFDEGNKKRKFLVKSIPDDKLFPNYQELNVVHNYLSSNSPGMGQARIRKSGQSGVWSYSYTIRQVKDNQVVETRTKVDRKEYAILEKTKALTQWTIYQTRRCFIWRNRYFRIDIYEEPCNPRCRGLILLSTRAVDKDLCLPDFLEIEKEVTHDENYSMFNLSNKDNK